MSRTRIGIAATLSGLACLGAVEARAGVGSDLLALTGGKRVQLVWSRAASWGGWANVSGGGNYRLIVFDTDTGAERDLLGTTGNFFAAKITHDGSQVVYKNGGDIWAVNWDGSNNRRLVAGAGMGCVSAGGYLYAVMGGGVRRVEIANPANQTQVYTGPIHEGGWYLSVSLDDRYLGCGWSGGVYGLVDTSSGSVNSFHNEGCWASVSPDTQYRFCVFDYPHRNWRVWNFDKSGYRLVNLNGGPGVNGWEVFYPRFAGNDSRYVTVSGPFDQGPMGSNNIANGSPNAEIYFGRFDAGLTQVEGWVRVTSNGEADYYANAVVGAGGTPPSTVTIDSFTASPSTISPGGSSTLSWATTNATSVSIDQGIGSVAPDGTRSVSPSSTTTYTLTAQGQGGPKTSSVTVTVVGQVSVPFRMNCGSDARNSGWAGDGAYVSGGADWDFSGSVDTSGVTEPAPGDVYLSVRHLAPSFSIPIANGTYRVRLHFYDQDANSTRAMNVSIEGTEVLSGYSIVEAAGGTSRAVVEEFAAAVGDGALDIVFDMGSGNDAFVSGVEVLAPGAPPAGRVSIDYFDASPVTIARGGSSALSWGTTNATSVTLNGTPVAADGSTAVTPGSTTTYTLVAQGQGGPVAQQVTVTVTAAPTVALTAPVGGEVWYVGTRPHITWSAANQTNVMILYTADDRQTYSIVAGTVWEGQPGWEDFVWAVPDTPSTRCRVRIVDYFAGTPSDESGLFEIRAVTDSDSDGMDDGWEVQHFGDTSRDGSGDYDADGRTDRDEFLAATDPTRPEPGMALGFGCALGGEFPAAAMLAMALAASASWCAKLRGRRR